MPKTLFRPQIDGIGKIPVDSISRSAISTQRKCFQAAVAEVIGILRPVYDGALEYYQVEEKLTASIEADIPSEFMQPHGLLLLVLDYFYFRRFRPRFCTSATPIPAQFGDFLCQRTGVYLQTNSRQLLTWLAIGYLIPADWLSADQLTASARRELECSGIVTNSSIELDLKIPPGGRRWFAEKTWQEFCNLKSHLDAGHPRPVRLIECSHSPYRNRTIIVYGYEEVNPQEINLYVYDINGLPVQKCLRLQWSNGCGCLSFTGSQIFQQAGELMGFYCEDYTAENPPLKPTMRWLRLTFPIKLAWYLVRYIRITGQWLAEKINIYSPIL